MEPHANSAPHLGTASKRLAQQALVICENRVELLLVELQEEREKIIRAFWLSLAVAVSSLLAGVAASIAIAVACWPWSPLGAMLILTAIYVGLALIFSGQLTRLRRDWRSLPATLDELRKDRECLTKHLN
jgi:uncharacterized membrane protein YqjE